MPCNCDHLEPTNREKELQRAAVLFIYLLEKVNAKVPQWLRDEAATIYTSDERCVIGLCACLKALSTSDLEKVLYSNPKDRMSRDLATWWEDHLEVDKKREEDEAERIVDELRAATGIAKLTPEERKALGL